MPLLEAERKRLLDKDMHLRAFVIIGHVVSLPRHGSRVALASSSSLLACFSRPSSGFLLS